MRSSLKWTLAATGIASLVAVWLEPGGHGEVPGVVGARASSPSSDPYGSWRTAAVATVLDAAGCEDVHFQPSDESHPAMVRTFTALNRPDVPLTNPWVLVGTKPR